MGFLVIPSASNTLANAIFYPSANVGSTLTGLVNGTSYKVYSTTAGPVVTPTAPAPTIPTTPTAPTTSWSPLVPLDGGPNGADAAFFRGIVTVVNDAYRVTSAPSNTNGRARYALPTAGTVLEMDSSIQFNDATRLICRQVDNNDSVGGTTIFDVTRTSTGQVLTRTDTFTVEAGKTLIHFIGVSATGQYFTINTATRIRIAANTVPSQLGTGDWSVSTGSSASQVSLNIINLPSSGGSAITALQYSINGGTSWTSLSGTGTGARTLTMAAAGTSYTFLVRAVNAIGNGTASASKTATSGTTSSTAPVTNVRTFTYQNSLFDHQGNGGADDDTRVPNWTQRMASAAGLTYQAVGFFGFAQQWTLPPNASAGYENVTAPAGLGFGQTWSGYSTINTLTFVPDNFDSFDRAPNVNSTNPSSPIGANQNYRDRLLQIIDAWETNAPMANSEKRKYRVYSGWADFNRSGGQWNTYTTTQLNTYLTYSYGQYQTWYVDLVNMLKTARPNLDIELIDLQRVVMQTWRNTSLNTLTGSRMWEDQAPHGTETWYLLAAMVYYMEIYGVKPPANFNPLAGTGAGSGVDAVLINNWSTIVDYAWTALGN